MKKILILLGLVYSIFMISCKETPNDTMTDLSEETSLKIREVYLKSYSNGYVGTIENISIVDYFGIYGESYAIIIGNDFLDIPSGARKVKIDDIEMCYSSYGPIISIYNNGIIYSLKEAYEKELVSKEDLLKIKEEKDDFVCSDFFY